MYVLKGKGWCPTVKDILGKSSDYAPARCMLITYSVAGDMIDGVDKGQPVMPGKTVLYQDHEQNQIEIMIESVVFGYMWGLSPGYCMIQFRPVEKDSMKGEKVDETTAEIKKEAVYGYCPQCGAVGDERERRPNGNDTCINGHTYPSSSARYADEKQ